MQAWSKPWGVSEAYDADEYPGELCLVASGDPRVLAEPSPNIDGIVRDGLPTGVADLEGLDIEAGLVNWGGARSHPLSMHEGQWKSPVPVRLAILESHHVW